MKKTATQSRAQPQMLANMILILCFAQEPTTDSGKREAKAARSRACSQKYSCPFFRRIFRSSFIIYLFQSYSPGEYAGFLFLSAPKSELMSDFNFIARDSCESDERVAFVRTRRALVPFALVLCRSVSHTHTRPPTGKTEHTSYFFASRKMPLKPFIHFR